MNSDNAILTADERAELELTALASHPLEEQYANLKQQHEASVLGMWAFLLTEVLFFGTLFLGLTVYQCTYPVAFEKGSEKLNWWIGGLNTVVLLISSLTMVLAVHSARVGHRTRLCTYLALTALLGAMFLGLKALEYYLDYRDKLIPGWNFDTEEWVTKENLARAEVPHVELFLIFYWVMTAFHGVHVTIGIGVVLWMLVRAWRGHFSPEQYTGVDVTGLYWHFVDVVWIFLLPALYLQGTHSLWGN